MTATIRSGRSSATILAAEPQLFSQDLEAAGEFYTARLGFAVAFSYGEPAFYMQVVRDGARLNIRLVKGPISETGPSAQEPDMLAATLVVDDVRLLFLEFEQRGVAFHQPLRKEPWGACTFIVKDPDDNLLCFAGSSAGD